MHAQDCVHKHRWFVQKVRLISIFVDEVPTMDYQSWLGVHVYLVDGQKCNLVLLTLEQVVNGGTIDNLTKVIMDIVLQYGDYQNLTLF